jgi:hypothetical protein
MLALSSRPPQVVSNADARANARPKAARLAEELEAARTAMSDFENALAASEGDKAQLHAEVQSLMDEMRLLQRDNARKEEALKSAPATQGGDGKGSAAGKSAKSRSLVASRLLHAFTCLSLLCRQRCFEKGLASRQI